MHRHAEDVFKTATNVVICRLFEAIVSVDVVLGVGSAWRLVIASVRVVKAAHAAAQRHANVFAAHLLALGVLVCLLLRPRSKCSIVEQIIGVAV